MTFSPTTTNTMLRTTALLIASLFFLIPAQAQDCQTVEDEFKGTTALRCDIGNVTVEEQPGENIFYTSAQIVTSEGTTAFVLTTASDSWNFLSIEEAYALIDGERFTFDAAQSDNEVDDGSVYEQTIIMLNDDAIARGRSATTFRMKMGRAVFDLSEAVPAIEEIARRQ